MTENNMNKYFKTFAMAVAVAGCSTSCSNNDNIVPEQPQNAYEQLTFSTADENAGKAATRAVWSDPNGKGNLIFNWEADDKGTEMVALLSDGSAFVRNYSSENPTGKSGRR